MRAVPGTWDIHVSGFTLPYTAALLTIFAAGVLFLGQNCLMHISVESIELSTHMRFPFL